VASVNQLSDRLRAEIGDIARSFTDTFTSDGIDTRYQLSQAPVQGYTLSVKATTPTLTATVTAASAASGVITYTAANSFAAGQVVTISGLSTPAFNITAATITFASATLFRITNNATGSAVTGASATALVPSVTTDISSFVTIEEGVGVITIQTGAVPVNNSTITVMGQAYRYFTDSEITYYINVAFLEHSNNSTDSNGSSITQIGLLPPIEEYPVVLLASTMALYTLATDSAFDIDIISPDGVSIPRSERFRQVNEMIQIRKDQYKELCAMLGVGLFRLEVMVLRRISRMTNRLIPVYRPQEIDDRSIAERVRLSLPEYGDITPPGTVVKRDISMYAGDDFEMDFQFAFDISTFTPKAQITIHSGQRYAQIGPLILGTFSFTKYSYNDNTVVDSLKLTLPGSVTEDLPRTAYYDIQLTSSTGIVKTYLTGKVFTERQITT
jgi:hypothetical protein